MTRAMYRRALLAVAGIGLAACGSPADDPADPIPRGPGELVIRVETIGGLVPDEIALTRVPSFSLYGDGRVVLHVPRAEDFPGPALPALVVRSVNEDGVSRIVREARAAGFFGPNFVYRCDTITDAPTTVFTTVTRTGRHVIEVDGINDCPVEGKRRAERDAIAKLRALAAGFEDLETGLPVHDLSPAEPYVFERLRVYVRDARPAEPEPDAVIPQVAAWPLTAKLASMGEPDPERAGVRCAVVEGDDLERLLPAVRKANRLTQWTQAGARHSVLFRPLLPDETAC